MRNYLLITFSLIFGVITCKGQSTLEINRLIDQLSWNSISFQRSYHAIFPGEDDVSYELLRIGKPAAEALYNSIEDPNKTAIIHIILTKLYEPNRDFFLPLIQYYSCSYIYKDPKQINGNHFIYNSLVWERSIIGFDSIQKDQIKKIKLLWDLRLHGKSNPFDLDVDSLIKDIHFKDSEKYSCIDNKIYTNNSSEIDISELVALIGTQYPSPYFNNILRKLGKDSITFHSDRNSSNISFISYPTDGIDFEFDDNNTLRTIFFNPIYEGLLFNNLKMSDTKEEIRRKVGQPVKFINIPRYKYDWIYKDYKMLIAFGHTDRIIDLQINNGINP